MIKRVEIVDPTRTPVKWWPDVEQLQAFTEFRFTPGINIIWGPNGSGKSTLLTALAHLTHSKQSGCSVVTHSSLRVINGRIGDRQSILDGMQLYQDGQSILYYSPQDSIGLISGTFDDDFIKEGVQSVYHRKISSGQSALVKFGTIMDHRGKDIRWKYKPWKENDPLAKAVKFTEETLSARCDDGPQTIIMDEPDAYMDWTNKIDFWFSLQRIMKFQVIVATHSPFGLRCPGANYIDLKKNYRLECKVALQMGGLWSHDWKRHHH